MMITLAENLLENTNCAMEITLKSDRFLIANTKSLEMWFSEFPWTA